MPRQETETYAGRAEYLAGEPESVGGITLDADLFTADSEGDICLAPGLLLAKPSATDLWGPYASGAADGRETALNNVLILHDPVNLKNGDKEVGVLLRGPVKGSKVVLIDDTPITDALRDALVTSRICDITFAIE